MVNSTRVPIYRDAGFELSNAELTAGAFEAETGHERDPGKYIYSRYRNPTVVAAEEEIMKTEGCEWALLAQSGMAAIDIALSLFQEAGDHRSWLFFSEIYGGTNSYIDSVLVKRRGIDAVRFDPDGNSYNLGRLESLIIEKKPALLYFEVISNPMLMIADATEIIAIARKHGVATIIDNTFATSMLYKPLDYGADIVIHSATKYLGGHGNITAGVLCGNNQDIMHRAIEYRKYAGHMLSADEAYRLHTQIQTFSLRFAQQCHNAMELATFITGNSTIEKVFYPGLSDHPTHDVAMKLFGGMGFGAMITFSFGGDGDSVKRERRDAFINALSGEIKLVPTLGDSHTILMPVEPVWGYKYNEPGMIRLSVGFEDTTYLLSLIGGALEAVV